MLLSLKKEQDTWCIMEAESVIYRIREEQENGLLSVYLQNAYGDDTLGAFQIQKKLSDKLRRKKAMEFTLYEHDYKIGELYGGKDGYELKNYGVFYRFFGGLHKQKKTIACFDRHLRIATFTLDEQQAFVSLGNEADNAIFALLLYVFLRHAEWTVFSEAAFLEHAQVQDVVEAA